MGRRADRRADRAHGRSGYPVLRQALVVAGAVAMTCAGAGITAFAAAAPRPPLAAGAWTARVLAAPTSVRDADGQLWHAATGLVGGRRIVTPIQAGTASPQLYRVSRLAPSSWTVRLPRAGRYAVDLLVPAPVTGAAPQPFDLIGGDGRRRWTLQSLACTNWAPDQPCHATAVVVAASTRLTLWFRPRHGKPVVVSALAVTTDPGTRPRTLLDESFDGPPGAPAPAPWRADAGSGPWGPGELEGYSASTANAHLDGRGHLVLRATRTPYVDAAGRDPYTSARLSTEGRLALRYGTAQARMWVPAGRGLWAAFWALGTDKPQVDWPRSGEIDVMEVLGDRPEMITGYLHGLGDARDPRRWRNQPVSSGGASTSAGTQLTGGYHVYQVDVTPITVTFRVDGRPFVVAAREDYRPGEQWPVGHPYYFILNLAVGGDWPKAPDHATRFPADFVVDDLRVTGWS